MEHFLIKTNFFVAFLKKDVNLKVYQIGTLRRRKYCKYFY